jgi:rare lipoprotein A
MGRRAIAFVVAVLGLSAGSLSMPAAGLASSGGGGLAQAQTPAPTAGAGRPSSSNAQGNAGTQPGDLTITASSDGMTIATRASTFLRNELRFTGNAPAGDAGQVVEIERMGHQTGWAWAPTVHARVQSDGSFAATWRANHIGRFAIRAVVQRPSSAGAATASPALTITVYRPAIATQYGPGLYGHRTACGQVLRPRTLGVANRTLKCGTPVAIYYQGRTIVVPVIDRGPYANNADWDLTEATGRALGIGGTATIGAVSLPGRS